MSKYQPLTDYLRRSGAVTVPMTFEDIERLIGAKLPPSSAQRPWWSNNPTNNVMTRAWCAAGYESTRVDMKSCTLVFRRVTSPGGEGGQDGGGAGGLGGARVSGETIAKTSAARQSASGHGDGDRGAPRRAGGSDWFAGFYGGLRGTVTIAPGTDLTAPVGAEGDAEHDGCRPASCSTPAR